MAKKTFHNVNSIQFRVKFNGEGCVNYDSPEQADYLKAYGLVKGKLEDNCKLSKKVFFEKDDKYYFKHMVSADCIRYNMFKKEQEYYNSGINAFPLLLYKYYATPAAIIRGYMNASKSDTSKKKSCLVITNAIENTEKGHSFVVTDIHSCSGAKTTDDKAVLKLINPDISFEKYDDNKKSTSLFFEELVPSCEYNARGAIDLSEAQFISTSTLFDRPAVSSKYIKTYVESLNKYLNENYEVKPYYIKTSFTEDVMYEDGILLSTETVSNLAKEALKRIMTLSITSKKGFFEFTNIEISICTVDGQSDWFEINSVEDLDNYEFIYNQKYSEVSEEKIAEMQALAIQYAEDIKAAEKAEKERKKAKKGKKAKNNE